MIGELRVFPLKVHSGVLLAHSVDDIRVGHPPFGETMTFLRFGGLSPLGDYRGFKDGSSFGSRTDWVTRVTPRSARDDTPLCTG